VLRQETVQGTSRVELEHDGYAWLPGSPRHHRVIELAPGRLEVHDRVDGGRHPWVSRIRVGVGSPVRVSGGRAASRRDDRWHPRHGDPRPAVVHDQRSGEERRVAWRIEW
jgi:hypothetical protein